MKSVVCFYALVEYMAELKKWFKRDLVIAASD